MSRLAMALLAVLAASGSTGAQGVPGRDTFSADYDRCVADDDSRAHMSNCLTEEHDRAEADLNREYRSVMARLTPARRQTLRAEEKRWVAERESACDAVYREMEGGNGAGEAETDCQIRHAIARIAELHRIP